MSHEVLSLLKEKERVRQSLNIVDLTIAQSKATLAASVIRRNVEVMKDMLIQLKHRDFCKEAMSVWQSEILYATSKALWFEAQAKHYGVLMGQNEAVKSE